MKAFYIITKFLTFPGAYLRGFWEHFTCKLCRLMVEPGGYVRVDEACGHVEHSLAKKGFGAYIMATLPGFFTFNMGLNFYLLGIINLKFMGITYADSIPLFIAYLLSLYIGFSLLCAQFPLTEDILNFWSLAYQGYGAEKHGIKKIFSVIGKVIVFIPAAFTRLGAFLEKTGIGFIIMTAITVLIFVFA